MGKTKKKRKKMNEGKKQNNPANDKTVMSREQLQAALENMYRMMQQMNEHFIRLIEKNGNLAIALSEKYPSMKKYHEQDFEQEYMQENFEHLFKDVYYDKKEDRHMRVTSYLEEWTLQEGSPSEEGVFTFTKDEENIEIEADNLQNAYVLLKNKLIENVTSEEEPSLQKDSELTEVK